MKWIAFLVFFHPGTRVAVVAVKIVRDVSLDHCLGFSKSPHNKEYINMQESMHNHFGTPLFVSLKENLLAPIQKTMPYWLVWYRWGDSSPQGSLKNCTQSLTRLCQILVWTKEKWRKSLSLREGEIAFFLARNLPLEIVLSNLQSFSATVGNIIMILGLFHHTIFSFLSYSLSHTSKQNSYI